ncbi:hypothetical protein NHX12_018575 [Muraenolepis orangiensis]|uniref:CBF1-interacting co-repressor CIR N-terminal domain-containing protein n=1 Tax=Muraenolepis orangiensis TaxID=630683 RepID=A0A9Q0EWP7_9TELE|nr:hypothetical protein NHX12_018575 [Muraenolepis orangiensis]
MGGGDLNLKKSWHPQTMKNIERVWKAEQKHEAECKKIEELQKELKDERAREEITKFAQETGALKKKDDRLDWMYQGPAGQVSRDEYLMGRPIDKQITEQFEEAESGPSTQTGLLPGSIFNPTTPASTLDLAAKIREDPLFEISGPQQPPAPSTHPGRTERNRSRSPNRNGTENHSSHHSDRKVDHRAPSPQKERYQRQTTHRSKQLSAEELENKRLEMMGFAKQRDKEREVNVKRYRKQDEQEKEREKGVKQVPHAGFIHNMKLESAASSSLEDRVKRKIHSIQRTTVSLEKNFMRR